MAENTENTYIVVRGYSKYEGWVGVLNSIVSISNSGGTIVSVSITPTPMAAQPLTEVYLPIKCIKAVSPKEKI
jgi:hypothetical protein